MRAFNKTTGLLFLTLATSSCSQSINNYRTARNQSGDQSKGLAQLSLAVSSGSLALADQQADSLSAKFVCQTPAVVSDLNSDGSIELHSLNAEGCEIQLEKFEVAGIAYQVSRPFSKYSAGGNAIFSGADGSSAIVNVVTQLSSPLSRNNLTVSYSAVLLAKGTLVSGTNSGEISNATVAIGVEQPVAIQLVAALRVPGVVGDDSNIHLSFGCLDAALTISTEELCGTPASQIEFAIVPSTTIEEPSFENLSAALAKSQSFAESLTIANSLATVEVSDQAGVADFWVIVRKKGAQAIRYSKLTFSALDAVDFAQEILAQINSGEDVSQSQLDAFFAAIDSALHNSTASQGLNLTEPSIACVQVMSDIQILERRIEYIRDELLGLPVRTVVSDLAAAHVAYEAAKAAKEDDEEDIARGEISVMQCPACDNERYQLDLAIRSYYGYSYTANGQLVEVDGTRRLAEIAQSNLNMAQMMLVTVTSKITELLQALLDLQRARTSNPACN
jgi:hypothetical protein